MMPRPQQLSLWPACQLSPIPEVRACAPLWTPESAASNAAELERLLPRRPRPDEVDCPWCGEIVPVDYDLGVSAGGGAWTRYAGLDDHQRPDGQRCRGTYEALEQLAGRGVS